MSIDPCVGKRHEAGKHAHARGYTWRPCDTDARLVAALMVASEATDTTDVLSFPQGVHTPARAMEWLVEQSQDVVFESAQWTKCAI